MTWAMTRDFSEAGVAAANDGRGFVFESDGDIGFGGLESGHEAEDDAGQNSDGESEE